MFFEDKRPQRDLKEYPNVRISGNGQAVIDILPYQGTFLRSIGMDEVWWLSQTPKDPIEATNVCEMIRRIMEEMPSQLQQSLAIWEKAVREYDWDYS